MPNRNIYKYDEMKRREHMAVRETVGWYLFTHHLIEVTGPDATAFLDKLCPKNIASLAVGRERYTTMLTEKAEIMDDVVVFRIDEGTYWVSTLFANKQVEWMRDHSEGFDVQWKVITQDWHMYAIQGPKSLELVNALVKKPVDDLKFFAFESNAIEGAQVMVNRAGFTGEKLGYEIYMHPDFCDRFEELIREKGEPLGAVQVTDIQLMVWTLPTEAGFWYMRDLQHLNPFEAGVDKGIDFTKDFIGKKPLMRIKKKGGAQRELVPFTVDEDDVFIHGHDLGGGGDYVFKDGEEVGRVWKFNFSFVLDKNYGYILAKKGGLDVVDKVIITPHEGSARRYEGTIVEKVAL